MSRRQKTSVGSILVETARAKINLALHVTGQRPDGYHLLESLVTFAELGDRLTFATAAKDTLTVSGPFARQLLTETDASGQHNLVVKARDALREHLLSTVIADARPVAIHLEKNLPIASGIGGGSADAAACLRGLIRFWQAMPSTGAPDAIAIRVGADVPMCLAGVPLVARGIGETLEPLADLPSFAIVLANPLTAVSTPQVFGLLTSKTNAPLVLPSAGAGAGGWLDAITAARNDLEPPARHLLAEIATLSDMLRDSGARLVRMSGSGATCFAICDTDSDAQAVETKLRALRPDWYIQATRTMTGGPAWLA